MLLLLEVWVFPRSPAFHKVGQLCYLAVMQPCRAGKASSLPSHFTLLQIVFAMVAGPLTWSIVALRNSLVLHSLDKVRYMASSPVPQYEPGMCWPRLKTCVALPPAALPPAVQITSLFMHISPAIVCWTWKW